MTLTSFNAIGLLESIFYFVLYRYRLSRRMLHTPARASHKDAVLQINVVLAALLTFQKISSTVVLNTLLDLCMIHARVCCGE